MAKIKIRGTEYNSQLNNAGDGKYGTYHLANNPNLYEIQRLNNFELIVALSSDTEDNNWIRANGSTLTGTNAKFDVSNTSAAANPQEVIRLSLSSAQIPHFTQETLTVNRGNNTFKFAGVPKFGSGSFEFNDYIGAETLEVLMAWQNKSYNVETEKVGLAADYKREAYLIEYSPDYQITHKWHIYGLWISGISEGTLSSDSNSVNKISVTFEYDRAVLDPTAPVVN